MCTLSRKERSQNYKPRSIRLPPAADLEKAKAEFVDGVLIIIIPKDVRHQGNSDAVSPKYPPPLSRCVYCIFQTCIQTWTQTCMAEQFVLAGGESSPAQGGCAVMASSRACDSRYAWMYYIVGKRQEYGFRRILAPAFHGL